MDIKFILLLETTHSFDVLSIFMNKIYSDWKMSRPGTVAGTFEDLSDEERTKAFLQLLEYRLKLEKVQYFRLTVDLFINLLISQMIRYQNVFVDFLRSLLRAKDDAKK